MRDLTEDQLDLIERIGVVQEMQGMRPAAARIVGLLLVAPEGELTFDEIRDALALSKSATSTSLSYLSDFQSVVYRTRPGDRKRYFRKNTEDWERQFTERAMGFLEIRSLLAEAAAMKAEEDPESARSLERMTGYLDLLAETVQEAFHRWTVAQDTPAPHSRNDRHGPPARRHSKTGKEAFHAETRS